MNQSIKQRMSNNEVWKLVNSCGLGDAVYQTLPYSCIEDKLLSAMWEDAQQRLWSIEHYLRDHSREGSYG